MLNTKHRIGSIIALVISAMIIGVSVWLFLNRQYAADALKVWTYQPSTEIMSIQQRAHFTEEGRFVFYATKPEILEAGKFNQECPRQEVGNPILGCYTGEDRIYIYDLTDAQLDGMEEVTATHEMLHAVWRRTGPAQREHLAALLNDAYRNLSDPALKNRMAYYQRTEPTEFTNELHSILGTEIAGLGDELETYYAQFFNRDTVLALHDNYNHFYTELTAQADELYQKMHPLSASIDERSAAYIQDVENLSTDIDDFNRRAAAGSFGSQSQFASERAALMRRSNQLETSRIAINNDIAIYNEYRSQYQTIAQQIQLLHDSMDSYHTLDKTPSV